MKTDCAHCDNVNAYVAGELSSGERSDFEIHIVTCEACRSAVESARRLVARLSSVPAVASSRDLAPLIMSRLQDEAREVPRRPIWPRIAAVAAGLVGIAGSVVLLRKPDAQEKGFPDVAAVNAVESQKTAASTAKALNWLVRTQEPDGSWNPERWGGERKFEPALCALPLLALLSADERTSAQENAVKLATAHLLDTANSDGTFGSVFQGAPYNDSIATLALLHAWQRKPGSIPKALLNAAVASLIHTQTANGGWGYQYSPVPDRSISKWHVQALKFAAQLGWGEAGPVAEHGLKWLATIGAQDGDAVSATAPPSNILVRASESSNAADPFARGLYQAYFTIAELRSNPAAHEQVIAMQDAILRRQESTGEVSGSWTPDDQWGRAGGRLYSTAIACLSIANGK